MTAKCPYCEAQLDITPKRKKGCPKCLGNIIIRKGELLTEDDAKIFDWMKRLAHLEVDKEYYQDEYEQLNNKFGKKPSVNDVIWSILNGLVAEGYAECYSDMVRIAREEGRDPMTYVKSQYAWEQSKGENLKNEFPDVRVVKEWFTCNDDECCKVCKELHGKIVDIDEFFSPGIFYPPGCDDCRCWMSTSTDITGELGK